jgi:hypothetical protein
MTFESSSGLPPMTFLNFKASVDNTFRLASNAENDMNVKLVSSESGMMYDVTCAWPSSFVNGEGVK